MNAAMQFRIADTFTDSLARLTPRERLTIRVRAGVGAPAASRGQWCAEAHSARSVWRRGGYWRADARPLLGWTAPDGIDVPE